MFSRTGHIILHVEAIANAIWLVDSHLDIFAPFFCGMSSCIFMVFTNIGSHGDCYDESFLLPLYPVISSLVIENAWIYWFIGVTYAIGRTGFRTFLWPLQGKVTLFCRLLVVWWPLCLVVLVFKDFSEILRRKVTPCCRLLVIGDCYVWSYWLSLLLTKSAILSSLLVSLCNLCDLYSWLYCNGMNYCYCLRYILLSLIPLVVLVAESLCLDVSWLL